MAGPSPIRPRGGIRSPPVGGCPRPYAEVVKRIAGSLGVALGVLAATLAILAAGGFGTPDPSVHRLDALGVGLAIGSAGPLALRRRMPLPSYVVSAAASVALLRLGYPLDAPLGAVVAA